MASWKLEAGISRPGSWELDGLGLRRAGKEVTNWKSNI